MKTQLQRERVCVRARAGYGSRDKSTSRFFSARLFISERNDAAGKNKHRELAHIVPPGAFDFKASSAAVKRRERALPGAARGEGAHKRMKRSGLKLFDSETSQVLLLLLLSPTNRNLLFLSPSTLAYGSFSIT